MLLCDHWYQAAPELLHHPELKLLYMLITNSSFPWLPPSGRGGLIWLQESVGGSRYLPHMKPFEMFLFVICCSSCPRPSWAVLIRHTVRCPFLGSDFSTGWTKILWNHEPDKVVPSWSCFIWCSITASSGHTYHVMQPPLAMADRIWTWPFCLQVCIFSSTLSLYFQGKVLGWSAWLWTPYVSEDSLELLTFLLPPPNLCDYKYALGYLVYVVLGSKLGACSANVPHPF